MSDVTKGKTTPSWVKVFGRLCDAEKERIDALVNKGWEGRRIARKLERHPSTVEYYLLKTGAKSCNTTLAGAGTAHRRGNGVVRRFDAAEDRFLLAARTAGHSLSLLSRNWENRFGHRRPPSSLRLRVMLLEARAEAAS